ncbi:MAG: hypothetical protein LAQ30_12420, partial [Acidobacteriia bacterium]|nr:hypothetical protein [Terriglobia bacterium]
MRRDLKRRVPIEAERLDVGRRIDDVGRAAASAETAAGAPSSAPAGRGLGILRRCRRGWISGLLGRLRGGSLGRRLARGSRCAAPRRHRPDALLP